MEKKTYTKGNVIVEDIKLGDIHYEFDYGCYVKVTVIELPEKIDGNYWQWKSKTDSGKIITYGVTEGMSHYGPNLYDYIAYTATEIK